MKETTRPPQDPAVQKCRKLSIKKVYHVVTLVLGSRNNSFEPRSDFTVSYHLCDVGPSARLACRCGVPVLLVLGDFEGKPRFR